MQINPKNYQSRPPLPEDMPVVHTDSSVHLTSFALYLKLPLDPCLIVVESCLRLSASRTASDVQERAADEPAVESVRTRKRSSVSAGSSDM